MVSYVQHGSWDEKLNLEMVRCVPEGLLTNASSGWLFAQGYKHVLHSCERGQFWVDGADAGGT